MIVPDENRNDIAKNLAFIALLPIDDADIKEKLAKLVANTAILIGGEEFMKDLLAETNVLYEKLMGRFTVQ